MAFDEKLQDLFKDKRVLIGAAVIGGLAGLYVLSRSGGGGTALQPATPLNPTQPGTGDGGGGSDTGDIIGRLTQLESNQTGFFSQVQAMIQQLADGFNSQIAGVQGQNASALQSVIDQVNAQLSNGQGQQYTVPDFAGFNSQLMAALEAVATVPQRVQSTGGILKNTLNAPRNSLAPVDQSVISKLNNLTGSARRTTSAARGIRVNRRLGVPTFGSYQEQLNRLSGAARAAFMQPPRYLVPDKPINTPKFPVIKRGGNAVLKGR